MTNLWWRFGGAWALHLKRLLWDPRTYQIPPHAFTEGTASPHAFTKGTTSPHAFTNPGLNSSGVFTGRWVTAASGSEVAAGGRSVAPRRMPREGPPRRSRAPAAVPELRPR